MYENLTTVNIAYVKLDYNRTMSNIGSALLSEEQQGEFFHRYILPMNSGIPYQLSKDFDSQILIFNKV